MNDDEIDTQGCEHCGATHPIEEMHMMEDCWFCSKCVEAFRATFAACQHSWEPHVNSMGEDGRFCTKCSGFVANEDFQVVGLPRAPAPTLENEEKHDAGPAD